MPKIDWAEARRYLGYLREQPDEIVERCLQDCGAELETVSEPRSIWKRCTITRASNRLLFAGMKIESQKLSAHLDTCDEIIVFAATLGAGVDRLIRRAGISDMGRAVILQACAASLLENLCDVCCDEIAAEVRVEGLFLRPRFSPGYGDFSICHQRELLAFLDAPKRIGLTATDEMMLAPTKSVTAIIGLTKESKSCRMDGCAVCNKGDCVFRKQPYQNECE